MKKIILLICVFAISVHLAKAQRPNPLQYTAIKFAPLSLIDIVNGSFDVIVEYKTPFPISGQVSYGIGIPYSAGFSDRVKDRFQKIKFELRTYFPSDFLQKRYVGIEGVFIPRRYEISNSFFTKGGTAFDFNKANVTSRTWALHLKLGTQKNWNGKLISDLFIGFGIRKLNNQFDPEEVTIRSPGSFFFFDEFIFFGNNQRRDGVSLSASMTFGINIGFFAGKK